MIPPSPVKPEPPLQIDVGDFASPDKAVDAILAKAKAHPGAIVGGTHGAWSVCFSTEGGRLGNVFSAKVRQRSTKERDWAILGRMAARVGAPESATPATIRTNPTASHYWIWGGSMSQDAAAAIADVARTSFAEANEDG